MGLLLNYKYYMYNEFDDLEPSIEIVTPKFEALWYIIERRFEFRAAQYDDVSDSAGTPRTGRLGHRAVVSSTLILCFIEPRSSTNASHCQPVCRVLRAHIARWSARNFIHVILPKITNVNLSKTSAFL